MQVVISQQLLIIRPHSTQILLQILRFTRQIRFHHSHIRKLSLGFLCDFFMSIITQWTCRKTFYIFPIGRYPTKWLEYGHKSCFLCFNNDFKWISSHLPIPVHFLSVRHCTYLLCILPSFYVHLDH